MKCRWICYKHTSGKLYLPYSFFFSFSEGAFEMLHVVSIVHCVENSECFQTKKIRCRPRRNGGCILSREHQDCWTTLPQTLEITVSHPWSLETFLPLWPIYYDVCTLPITVAPLWSSLEDFELANQLVGSHILSEHPLCTTRFGKNAGYSPMPPHTKEKVSALRLQIQNLSNNKSNQIDQINFLLWKNTNFETFCQLILLRHHCCAPSARPVETKAHAQSFSCSFLFLRITTSLHPLAA